MSIGEEIQHFLLNSKVIDLAVAVVFGRTFYELVSAMVTDLAFPLLSVIVGDIDFNNMIWSYGKVNFDYGNLLQTFLVFIISILIVFFVFIKPFNQIVKANEDKNKAQVDLQQSEVINKLEQIRVLMESLILRRPNLIA
jgi:large conductance mechanosensitive channel